MNRSTTFALDALCLVLLVVIVLGTGHLLLTTALGIAETLTQAATLKGM